MPTFDQLFEATYKNYPLLTAEQEKKLARKGDKKSRDILVQSNLRLVRQCLKRLRVRRHNYEDAHSMGVMGLLKAVAKYDYRKNIRFATYATYWVDRYIKYGMSEEYMIHVPNYMFSKRTQKSKFVSFLQRALQSTVALDAHSDLKKEETPCLVELNEERHLTRQCVKLLTEMQRFVITRRFGLDGQPEMTLKEIGDKINLTRERVRQIETDALNKLRKVMECES